MLASAPDSEPLPGPIAFFGHSMGALVAFEVARRFESAGDPVSALFVSACSAPGVMRDEYFRDLSDDELVTFLVDLSGTDPKVLNNKEFVDIDVYRHCAATTTPLPATPVRAERRCHAPSMRSWALMTVLPDTRTCRRGRRTRRQSSLCGCFDGDHFYFTKHLPEVAQDVEMRFHEAALRRERGERV